MSSIPLRIRFNEIGRFIKTYDETRYLVLLSYLYDEIFNRIKYPISKKSDITDSISYNFEITRIDSYSSLPLEKILIFHNVIIFIQSVFNVNKNKYYYNTSLEKGLNKDTSDTLYF